MKIKKVVLLMFLPFLVLNIGMLKAKAWKCIYSVSEVKQDGNEEVRDFPIRPATAVPPDEDGYGEFIVDEYMQMGLINADTITDGSDKPENPYSIQAAAYIGKDGVSYRFKNIIKIANEKNCPKFLYKYDGTYFIGNVDPKSSYWVDPKKLQFTGGIKSRINDNGKESTQSQSNSSGAGTSATSGCGVFGTTTTKYIKLANNILRIGGPILVIALGIMDFLKILLSGEEKVYKEAILRFIKRLIALVALLLLPYILFFILKISGVLKMYGISNQDIFCVLGF